MERILLWESGTPGYQAAYGQPEPYLQPYWIEDAAVHPVMILCPGGGYTHIGTKEGEPVARWLNSIGIHVLQLQYRYKPYTGPIIVEDIRRAIRLARFWLEEKGKPAPVGVMGFSAGGHLAACAALYFDAPYKQRDAADAYSSRPDAAVLCYSVLSSGPKADVDEVYRSFLGEEPEGQEESWYVPDQHVRPDMPPVFLWHTAEDPVVPVYNSLQMAQALQEKGVPVELHLYPHGPHALALATERSDGAEDWTEACARWLQRVWKQPAL